MPVPEALQEAPPLVLLYTPDAAPYEPAIDSRGSHGIDRNRGDTRVGRQTVTRGIPSGAAVGALVDPHIIRPHVDGGRSLRIYRQGPVVSWPVPWQAVVDGHPSAATIDALITPHKTKAA